jgi:hypothetical protein
MFDREAGCCCLADRARGRVSRGCLPGITLAGNAVFVADTANHRVQVFERTGPSAVMRGCVFVIAITAVLATRMTSAQVQVTSPTNKHNLSVSGPGPVKSTTMTEIACSATRRTTRTPAAPA